MKRLRLPFKKRLFFYFFTAITLTLIFGGAVSDFFWIKKGVHERLDHYENLATAAGQLIAPAVAKNDWKAVKMVLDDRVDAMIADYPICLVSVFRYPEAGLVSVITPITYEPLGIAVKADDAHMINWLENYLRIAKDGGQLDLLKARWFRDKSWLDRLP